MYNYYDQMSIYCDKAEISWHDRLKNIVGRFDEAIDVSAEEEEGGILSQRIRKYVQLDSISDKNAQPVINGAFNWARMVPEQRLYSALKDISSNTLDASRFPC